MANETSFDVMVIGAGPGGYVAAIRAAQLGLKVACVEKDKTLGGTCLNVGCIPSKALLESSEAYAHAKEELAAHGVNAKSVSVDLKKMMKRKEEIVTKLTGGIGFLFKKNKITSIKGTAQITQDKKVVVGDKTYEAKHIILATGSVPMNIPGIEVDQEKIVDSTGALALKKIPKKMIVIGGGYIGLEMGSVYGRLGSQITVVEAFDRIVPAMDLEVGKAFTKILANQGMDIKTSTKVLGATSKRSGVELEVEVKGKKEKLSADVVLVSIGRRPATSGIGLKECGIQMNDRGFIEVNDKYQTSVPNIYAIGDIIHGPMLAHKASEEGVATAEIIAGHSGLVNYNAIPSVVYTHPEVASVGLTEEQAKEQGLDYKKSKFLFGANGRALSMGTTDGFVKLIADKKTDRLLGAHILGPRASDLISELVLALEFSASAEDIALTIHAHPTLSEVVKEAALGLGDGAIHG